MTAALGDPVRLITVLGMLSIVPVIMLYAIPKNGNSAVAIPYICIGMIAWMSIVLSFLLPYDFRGDVDVMEELKALPITPSRLALGQILSPTLVATGSQAIAMIVVIVGSEGLGVVTWAVLGFL